MEVREWEEIQIVIPRTENGVKPEAGESEQLFGMAYLAWLEAGSRSQKQVLEVIVQPSSSEQLFRMAHGWIGKLDRFSL